MVMNKILFILFGITLYFSMNNALTKMTIADCNYGIQLACEELKNGQN